MNRTHHSNPALQQLQRVISITSKSMFGCIGVYSGGAFFAIIDGERVYFKVDEHSRSTYERRSMEPFKPYGDGRQISSFYEVPPGVLAELQTLREWASAATAAANRRKKG